MKIMTMKIIIIKNRFFKINLKFRIYFINYYIKEKSTVKF